MSQNQYFAADEQDEKELERLRIQEITTDPRTISRFKMIGVAEGWHCLEVGAGSGSIAEWLATQVGSKGNVVATDINPRFLRRLNMSNLEIRQHDIVRDDLESNSYDLVHCRTVLMHLRDPDKALKKMADAVRPGGWLVIEEADFGSVAADLTHPSAALFNSIIQRIYTPSPDISTANTYFGRQAPGMVEKLGFIETAHEGWVRVIRGGETPATSQSRTIRVVSERLIAAGIITREQHDAIQRSYQDPSFSYIGPMIFTVWGKKPSVCSEGEQT